MFNSGKTKIAELEKENRELKAAAAKQRAFVKSSMDRAQFERKYYPGEVLGQDDQTGLLADAEHIREVADIAQNSKLQFVIYDFREKWLAERARDSKEFIGGLEAIDQFKRLLLKYVVAYSIILETKENQA